MSTAGVSIVSAMLHRRYVLPTAARKDLEMVVQEAWDEWPREKMMQTMAHMVDVCRAIVSVDGGNRYKRSSKFAVEKY